MPSTRASSPSSSISSTDPSAPRRRAVLVAIQLPGVTDVEHAADLAELGRLVKTLGYDVARP
jgi:GTPase